MATRSLTHTPLLLALMVAVWGAASQDPSAYCYVHISDGAETCYYYHPGGYECDTHPAPQDPNFRNLTECNSIGVCYVPLAGQDEVCYYTPPYGYDCYYKNVQNITAALIHCDDLKANSAPEVTFLSISPSTDEDTVLAITDISIIDRDADQSEREGNGYITVTVTATNGRVKFDPSVALTGTDLTDAITAIENDKALEPVETVGGSEFFTNASLYLAQQRFDARNIPLGKIMKAFVFLPNQDFHGTSTVTFNANDNGNTGGTAEVDEQTLEITVVSINDPPVIIAGTLASRTADEDTARGIPGIEVSDVDVGESTPPNLEVTVEVMPTGSPVGTIRFSEQVNTALSGSIQTVNPFVDTNFIRMVSTEVELNRVLGSMSFNPNPDFNGNAIIRVIADDGGRTGSEIPIDPKSTTLDISVPVTAVNDDPVVVAADALSVNEEVAFTLHGISIADVDTTTGMTLTVVSTNGMLSSTTPVALGPTKTLVHVADMSVLNTLLDNIQFVGDEFYNGVESLSITALDSLGGSTTISVDIVVNAVNNRPELSFHCDTQCTGGTFASTSIDMSASSTVLNFIGTGASSDSQPLVQVADPDVNENPDSPNILVFLMASHGTFAMTPAVTTTLTFDVPNGAEGSAVDEDTLYFSGSLANVNAALAAMTYTKSDSTTGPADTLIFTVNDLQNTGIGGEKTDYLAYPLAP